MNVLTPAYPFSVPIDGLSDQAAAILPVIATMRAESHTPFTLDDLADMAFMSRFHFNRVFAAVAGIPPGEFMTALRFERAKELLLTTDLSVTDVCFEVGYGSLGTFSARFTQLVGVSPAEFRRLPDLIDRGTPRVCQRRLAAPGAYSNAYVHGEVRGLGLLGGAVYIGLFPGRVARGRPATGTLLQDSTSFLLHNLPPGHYRLLAAALPAGQGLIDHLRPDEHLLVGAGEFPLDIVRGDEQIRCDIHLRPPHITDAPILVSLPALVVT
jgi:AraC-like DNA-binding protein